MYSRQHSYLIATVTSSTVSTCEEHLSVYSIRSTYSVPWYIAPLHSVSVSAPWRRRRADAGSLRSTENAQQKYSVADSARLSQNRNYWICASVPFLVNCCPITDYSASDAAQPSLPPQVRHLFPPFPLFPFRTEYFLSHSFPLLYSCTTLPLPGEAIIYHSFHSASTQYCVGPHPSLVPLQPAISSLQTRSSLVVDAWLAEHGVYHSSHRSVIT